MKTYPIAKPSLAKEEIQAVLKVLRSGNLSLGPNYKEFETQFARKMGVPYACAVSSGTAGLHLAMISSGIGPGDEIITTPFSFIASANSILYVGAKPVFVDIDAETYNIDPKKIEEKITNKTKAILVVHIFGQCADMKPILAIAKKHRLKIIEDACESILATYKNKVAGTFGESAVFAFYPNKQITTGEGGMIITRSKKIYATCASLRNQGRSGDMQWLDLKSLGYNYRMDEMSAALGLTQLRKIDRFIAERTRIAQLYAKHLAPYAHLVQIPATRSGNKHTWFVYVILVKNKRISRDGIISALARQGISAKPYLPAIHLFSFYRKKFGYKKGDFPITESVSSSSLALPMYLGLKEADIKYIVKKLIHVIHHGQ